MTAAAFPHTERELVASLGLTQKAVRSVRADDLDRTIDWDTVGGEVRYSAAGRAKLLSLLKISAEPAPPGAEPPLLEKNPSDPLRTFGLVPERLDDGTHALVVTDKPASGALTAESREDLVCHKQYKPNRRILEAKRSNGELVLVRVKDNTNLLPGMVMKCRFGAGRVWELDQRLPRKRGRW